MKKTLLITLGILVLMGVCFVFYISENKNVDDAEQFIKKDVTEFYSSYGKGQSPKNITYLTKSIDLNDDGISEIIVYDVRADGVFMGGASGNQQYLVYGEIDSKWQRIGQWDGNQYTVLNEKIEGYHVIETRWHMSVASYELYTYKWSTSQHTYLKSNSSMVDLTQ